MRSYPPRPHAAIVQKLRGAGLRPTKQRLALSRCLFSGPDRHITAEALHEEVVGGGLPVSLATVYNTLHQFTAAGLLREVAIDGAKTYFDTNTSHHHHFYCPESGAIEDIKGDGIAVSGLPDAPPGHTIEAVNVIIRLRSNLNN